PVLAFDQESLRGEPPPDVTVGQVLYQLERWRLAKSRLLGLRGALGRHAPDAAAFATFKVQPFFHVVRERNGCFDHLATEVQDVKRTIRPDGDVDRPEPIVGRGQKVEISVDAPRGEGRAARR